MHDPLEDFEAIEQAGILIALGIGAYLLYRLYKSLTKDENAYIAGLQSWVGSGQPLTYPQAAGIANLIGSISSPTSIFGDEGSWQQSPDKIQIWFSDSSYYDNRDAGYYQADGSLIGNLKTEIQSMAG